MDLRGVKEASEMVSISEIQRVIDQLHRYTITGEGATSGSFRLVEDPKGCWVQWPEVEALRIAVTLPAEKSKKWE